MLTPSVSFRRGKQQVGDIAILFSGPLQKWPKANPCSPKSSELKARGKKCIPFMLGLKGWRAGSTLMNCKFNAKLNLHAPEWELKLNVNVLLALCGCQNTHRTAWVLADYWCSVLVPRLWTANARRENAYAQAPFINLHCAASILRQQTVQHKRIISETQKSELRGPDSSPQGDRGQ